MGECWFKVGDRVRNTGTDLEGTVWGLERVGHNVSWCPKPGGAEWTLRVKDRKGQVSSWHYQWAFELLAPPDPYIDQELREMLE